MNEFNMTADDASNVVAQLPDSDRLRVYYEGNSLFVPPDLEAAVAAAIDNLPAARCDALKRYAAAKRYSAEVGGAAVSGLVYPSDRESQAKFTSAVLMAQLNPAASFQWKTATGFQTLSASALLAVATTVGIHVQACFALEQSIGALIDGGTLTSTTQIDAAAWPPNS